MIPGILGVAAYQINVLLTNGIAWLVNEEIVASFVYAVRLMELPQGVFGLSMATYLLPTLAGLASDKNYGMFRQTLAQGVSYLVLINLLASMLLFVLAEPMVRLLLERGQFDAYATGRAALALRFLAPGLLGFSLVNILARAFYAVGDLKTPMWISVTCLIINVLLVALFILPLREAAMGMANTATALLNMALLFYCLRRRLGRLDMGALLSQLPGLGGAVLVAGLAAHYSSAYWTQHFGHDTLATKIGEVFLPMTLAAAAYFGVALLLKLPVATEFARFLLRRSKPPA
jgi:putative peptidoglycan lipid II flippase